MFLLMEFKIKEIKNVRELTYPIEWCFRFVIVAMLLLILNRLYPSQSLLFPFAYYAFIVGALLAFICQISYLWNWLKDKE